MAILAIVLAYRYRQEQIAAAEGGEATIASGNTGINDTLSQVHDIVRTGSEQIVDSALWLYHTSSNSDSNSPVPKRNFGGDTAPGAAEMTRESVSTTMSEDESVLARAQTPEPFLDSATTKAAIASVHPPNGGVFRNDIRQEWIDAVFGPDFFPPTKGYDPNYRPPQQGVGLSGVASYVSLQATIPAGVKDSGDKAGVTLARMPLGLYVRTIEPGSEAAYAGVQEGSILIDVNGMGLLGEPSKHALERLWQYEGYNDTAAAASGMAATNNNQNQKTGRRGSASKTGSDDKDPNSSSSSGASSFTNRPVAMKFIKNGKTYSVVFLANPPFGIAWAPCGNFAMIQRSHSFAAEAGVRSGSLVAAVNGKTLRTLDHESSAAAIKEAFNDGEAVHMTFAYTPASSRAAFFDQLVTESMGAKAQSPKAKKKLAELDGVEVRYHPLEYGIASLFMGQKEQPTKPTDGGVAELASLVAAGEVEPPSSASTMRQAVAVLSAAMEGAGTRRATADDAVVDKPRPKRRRPTRIYPRCPPLSKDQIIPKWDALRSLLFLSQACAVGFDDQEMLRVIPSNDNVRPPFGVLEELAQGEDFWMTVHVLLLQWVSMLCSFDETEQKDETTNHVEAQDKANYAKEITALLLSMVSANMHTGGCHNGIPPLHLSVRTVFVCSRQVHMRTQSFIQSRKTADKM